MRELIAERVTDELVRREPDALAVRPAVVSAVSGVVGGDAFASLFRSGVRDVHGAVFRRKQNTVTLTVADVGVVAAEALRLLQPQLASELEAREPAALVDYDVGGLTGDLARAARNARVLVVVLALLTVAAAAGGLALSSDRRRAAANLGIAIAVAGVVIVVAQLVARTIVLDRFDAPEQRAAAAAVWDAYLGDLRTTGWLIAGAGAVLAAAAASLIRPLEVEARLRAAWRIVSAEPRSPALRVARGLALVAIGALLIAQPAAVLQVLVTVGGVYVLYKGLEAIMRVVNGRAPAERPRAAVAGDRRPDRRRAAGRRRDRDLRHRRRNRRADSDDRAVQRPRGAVRPPARRGHAAGHPQLDVGPAAGLVRRAPGAPDQRASSRTASAACCSTPTTRTGWRTAARARTSGTRRRCSARSPRTGSARRASRPRCGCATGSGSAARASAGCISATRSASSAPLRWRTCSTTSTRSS